MISFVDITKLLPLSRNRQLSQFESLRDIEDWWNYHSNIVTENWYFYLGFQNLFLRRFESEDDREFMTRVETATIENHVKPIINLMVSHLYGSQDSVMRYVKRDDFPDDIINETLKTSVWDHNNNDELNDTKALNTLITGYTVIEREFVDIRSDEPFIPGSSPQDYIKYGIIKKTPLDSEYCVPLPYIDEYGTILPRRLGAVLYMADYDSFVGNKTVMDLMSRSRQETSVITYIDDKVWLKWVKNQEKNTWTQVTVNPGTGYENRNPYGKVSTAFTVYKNTGDPFYVEGDSDVPAVKSLNIELNELANGDKDTIRYHQYPILVGLNGATLPAGFRRTKNAVIELDRKDAKFEYLTWEGKLEASQKRQDEIKRAMSNVTGLSLISRGFLRDIGQIRSGPPLKALFTSDRAVMNRKFTAFRTSEIEDMKADIKFYEYHTKVNLNVDKKVSFHADFASDFLGIDRLLEEEIQTLRVQSGTASIEEVVKTQHPDWSEDEVSKEVERIQKAKQAAKPNPANPTKSSDKKALEQK